MPKNTDIIPEEIADDEFLYRGVTTFNWDEENNRPSSATFKDSLGASVDRDYNRDKDSCVNSLLSVKNFKAVCRVKAKDVRDSDALALYKPSIRNKYHSEIHDSAERIELSSKKAKRIRDQSEIVYPD